MTLSLAAVFIPVLFLGGILGRLFREFAVTICVAILISGIVSVTLTPMLCSRFLRSPEEQKRSWFYRITERFFEALLRLYDYTLKIVLRHRALTMAASLAVLAGTVGHVRQDPQGLHSGSGHRSDLWCDGSRARHLLLPNGGLSEARRPRCFAPTPTSWP